MLICSGISSHAQINTNKHDQQPEIIYHLFQRSFYDSNGDLQGDLNGIVSKLDYLQDLGVTSILLLPLYKSVYYHNYFADDFEKIDEECGTMQDFLDLVKAAHQPEWPQKVRVWAWLQRYRGIGYGWARCAWRKGRVDIALEKMHATAWQSIDNECGETRCR